MRECVQQTAKMGWQGGRGGRLRRWGMGEAVRDGDSAAPGNAGGGGGCAVEARLDGAAPGCARPAVGHRFAVGAAEAGVHWVVCPVDGATVQLYSRSSIPNIIHEGLEQHTELLFFFSELDAAKSVNSLS